MPLVLSQEAQNARSGEYAEDSNGKDSGAMAMIVQVQVRCAACNRRLADIVNQIETGQVVLELKCPRCGYPHLEILRRLDSRILTAPRAVAASDPTGPPIAPSAGAEEMRR
jgi:hypothetical protein